MKPKDLRLTLAITTSATAIAWSAFLQPIQGSPQATGELPASAQTYCDGNGVRFSYPRTWKIEKSDDKETLIKVVAGHGDGEISLSASANEEHLSLDAWLKVLNELFYSKTENFQELSREYVLIGRRENIPALLLKMKFSYQGFPVRQQLVLMAIKDKIYSLSFVESFVQPPSPALWSQVLHSVDMPDQLVADSRSNFPLQTAKRLGASSAHCDREQGCSLTITARPAAHLSLDQKIAAILPRPQEERWLQIPWETNLMAARLKAQQQRKPLFVWIMDGNVIGAT